MAFKENGGLGVNGLFVVNRAVLFKWLWRFFKEPNSLWGQVIKVIHGYDGNLNISTPSYRSTGAYILASIHKLKSKGVHLLSYYQRIVANGESTMFGKDTWLDNAPLMTRFPSYFYWNQISKCRLQRN